jgi:hypothetical protein
MRMVGPGDLPNSSSYKGLDCLTDLLAHFGVKRPFRQLSNLCHHPPSISFAIASRAIRFRSAALVYRCTSLNEACPVIAAI